MPNIKKIDEILQKPISQKFCFKRGITLSIFIRGITLSIIFLLFVS
jgi:hypothetical protein